MFLACWLRPVALALRSVDGWRRHRSSPAPGHSTKTISRPAADAAARGRVARFARSESAVASFLAGKLQRATASTPTSSGAETRSVGRCTQPLPWLDRLDRHGSAVHADRLAERALLAAERGARFIRSYRWPRLHCSRRPFPGGTCSLARDPRGRARRLGRHRCSAGGHSGWVPGELAACAARGSCRSARASRAGGSRRTSSSTAQERAAVRGSDLRPIGKGGKNCWLCAARPTSGCRSRCAAGAEPQLLCSAGSCCAWRAARSSR